MRLKSEIVEAIRLAVDELGTQKALADISDISCKNINKYVNGGVKTIRSEAWQKLLPHIAKYLKISPETADVLHNIQEAETMEKRIFWNIELSGMIRAFTDCRIGTGYAIAIDNKLWAMRPKEVEEIPITMAQAAAIASVVIAQVEEDQ